MKKHSITKTIIIIPFVLLLFSCADSHKTDDEELGKYLFIQKVNKYIEAHHANHRFNGNILIAKGDSILYSKSYGKANREFNIPNSDSTCFLIGSITKPFTSYGILLLEKQGKLSLDDKLSKYFPDYPKADQVNIRQLLTHTSGITDYHNFSNWREDGKGNITPIKTIQTVSQNPYIFKQGERFSYSNTGYIFLGLIIEQVSSKSFAEFIQENILNPMGLKQTGVIDNESLISHLASGYTSNLRETKKADYINYMQPFSSGNMYSTCFDLWKFTKLVIQSKLLSEEKTKEIFNVSEVYGYGWGIRNYEGVKAYGHHGAMNGFSGSITYIPDGDYFICFLTNDDNTMKYTLAEDLCALVLGKEVAAPAQTNLIELTEKMKGRVIGEYLIKPGDTLNVYQQNGNLYLRETGQEPQELFPIGQTEFAFTLLEFRIAFVEIENKKAQKIKFIGKNNLEALRINKD